MVNNSLLKTAIGIIILFLPLLSIAQIVESNEARGSVSVLGTSSLHDWEMALSSFQASAELKQNDEGDYIIEDARFTANANNLSSDQSLMNKKAHEALETDDHPQISFQQIGKSSSITGKKSSVKIGGKLKIAGETKQLNVNLDASINDNNELKINGKTKFKMTDFNISPPRAMLGTIKTGDEVTVTVEFNLN